MPRTIDPRISRSREILQNPYAHLNGDGGYDALFPDEAKAHARIDIAEVLKGRAKSGSYTRREIGRVVRNLHAAMWRRRDDFFTRGLNDPLQLLDPFIALDSIGYRVVMRESLGQHLEGKNSFEVAGIVDNSSDRVEISRRFSPTSRRFTAAHELGHALLHDGSGLHRDRAPDGSGFGCRDSREAEADFFASCFLLPEKIVRAQFRARFLTERFRLTEESAFALGSGSLREVRARCRTERALARMLAATTQYNGAYFKSLAEQFGVSVAVVAIGVEELKLATVDIA